MDSRCLAVHWSFRPYDLSAVCRTDTLVAQAHTEDRNRIAEAADQLSRDSCFGRRAGSRADDDVARLQYGNFLEGDRIVSADDRLLTQFRDIASQVVHEAVVIIDQQNHGVVTPPARAFTSA